MNGDLIRFLRKNKVKLEQIYRCVDSRIYSVSDINTIVDKFGVYKKHIDDRVSVADIVGYNSSKSYDIFSSFGNFFDCNGDDYRMRSIGMLDYDSDEIINKLSYSFKVEPVMIDEIAFHKYVVNVNGYHRFTVLKAHYLIECSKVKGDFDAINKLKDKYEIPVLLNKLDVVKTYSRYLLWLTGMLVSFDLEFNNNFQRTGRVIVQMSDGMLKVMDDVELIHFVYRYFKYLSCYDIEKSIPKGCSDDIYFRWYMNKFFGDLNISLMNYGYKGRKKVMALSF